MIFLKLQQIQQIQQIQIQIQIQQIQIQIQIQTNTNTNDLLSKVHVHGDLSLSAQNINLKNLRKLKIIT